VSVTDYQVISAMRYHGGSFAEALALAFFKADPDNRQRLKAAFPELWREYSELAELMSEEFRPWLP